MSDLHKRKWCMNGNTSDVQSEVSRSNRDFRTQFTQLCLVEREAVKEKGTVFDENIGKDYRKMWQRNLKNAKTQKSLLDVAEPTTRNITFERVIDDDKAGQWKFICDTFHYVPHPSDSIKAYGRFLRYFIKLNGEVIGIIAISGSFLSIEARDKFIGWNKEQRMKNNRKICQNLVYCILPSVKLHNLSSMILSRFCKVAKRDWKAQYGDTLVLMDTLVTPELYKGTSYLASGWLNVGMTKGYGSKSMRKDVKGYGAKNMGRVLFKHDIKKMVFVKPLHRYWQKELLSLEPRKQVT